MLRVRSPYRLIFSCILLVSVLGLGSFTVAQEKKSDTADQPASGSQVQSQDPLTRPLTEKQKKENEKRFKQEIGQSYRKWLDEDVRWIISDEERSAFKQLSNDEERDNFIEAFWQPTHSNR